MFKVDGQKFLPRSPAGFPTTLDEMDPAGALRPGVSVPGLLRGIARASSARTGP
jgi:hypothetical protein